MEEKGIFLCRSSPFQIYSANKLFKAGIISSVIIEDGKSILIDNKSKNIKLNPKYYYQQFLWGDQNFHNERILKSNYKIFHKEINLYNVKNINSKDALCKIKELNPSIIIVHGTRIIKDEILEDVCCDFINIHWGLSPDYRGDGIITPIYFKNWEKIGFTIHKLDNGIDSGDIVCREKIEIDERDNCYSIGLKMTRKAIEYLSNGLIINNKLNSSIIPSKQDLSKGILANSAFLKKNFHIKLFSPINLFIKKLQIKFLRESKTILKSLIGITTYPFISKSDKVFLFHEVTNNPSEFAIDHDLFLDNDTFEKQIKWISKKYRIIDPNNLTDESNLVDKKHKKNALITFDDGSASIFENAAPILRKYGLRAIVFLNMAPIKGEEDFYSGLICYLNSKDYLFKKTMKNIYPDKNDNFLFFSMNDIQNFSSATKTIDFSKKLQRYHGKFASIKQLIENDDVFVYGSHLYNHYNAVNLTKSELALQLEKNSNALKKVNGDSKLFSYPFGQPDSCYNSETDKTLRDLGIKKIFYANILENKSFHQNYFYRIATEKRFNLGYMKFTSIFRPFFNQLITNYKNKN